jgi:hypothetical protein
VQLGRQLSCLWGRFPTVQTWWYRDGWITITIQRELSRDLIMRYINELSKGSVLGLKFSQTTSNRNVP